MLTQVDRVDALVRYWIELCPSLVYKRGGNRAESAASLTNWHNWKRINEPPYSYYINGHYCSWENKVCDCLDQGAPIHPEFGRLCKHRLAVWMIKHLAAEAYEYLETLIMRAAEKAVPELVLTVRTTYTHGTTRNNTQINHLLDWRSTGHTRQLAENQVTFSINTLQFILFENRYCIAPGRRIILDRHLGGRERWFLIPMPADASNDPFLATNVGMLFGIDLAISEERAQRRHLDQLFTQQTNHQSVPDKLPAAG